MELTLEEVKVGAKREDFRAGVQMRALWASGPGDVWTVGDQGRVFHHDGTDVTRIDTGSLRDLYAVWGSGPADVWAVGDGRNLHYDGTSWSSFPPPTRRGCWRWPTSTSPGSWSVWSG